MESSEREAWLARRKQYLTATDVAKILNYVVMGNSRYYNRSIYRFTNEKLNPRPTTQYEEKLFQTAHIHEEQYGYEIINEYEEKGEDINISHNDFITKGIFSATLDYKLVNENVNEIHEVKATSSINMYNDFLHGRHPSFFQACMQLYCSPPEVTAVKMIVRPMVHFGYGEEYQEDLSMVVNRDSWHYKELEKNIPILEEVYEAYKNGEEFFKRSQVPSHVQETALLLSSLKAQIETLTLRKKSIEEELIQYCDVEGINGFEIPELFNVEIAKRSSKKVDDKYKEIYNTHKNAYIEKMHESLAEEYGEIFTVSETRYINIKEIKK